MAAATQARVVATAAGKAGVARAVAMVAGKEVAMAAASQGLFQQDDDVFQTRQTRLRHTLPAR